MQRPSTNHLHAPLLSARDNTIMVQAVSGSLRVVSGALRLRTDCGGALQRRGGEGQPRVGAFSRRPTRTSQASADRLHLPIHLREGRCDGADDDGVGREGGEDGDVGDRAEAHILL